MPPDIARDANASQPMLDPANVGIINKVTENSPVPAPPDLGPLSAPTGLATAAAQPAPPTVPLHSRIADGIIHAFAGTNGTPGDALRSALAGGLAGLAAAARTPRKPGDPIGSGIGIGAGAAMEDAQKRQAIQQQQKQQQLENQQNQQKLDNQTKMDQVLTAKANADMVHEQQLLHHTSDEEVDKSIASGKTALQAVSTAPQAGEVLHRDVTKSELETLLAQDKIDPTTGTAYPTGKKLVGKNDDGTPLYETTYSFAKLPPEITLDDKSREVLKGIPEFDRLTVGTKMSGAQYNSLFQQAQDISTATAARNHTLVQNKLATEAEAQAMEQVDIGSDWDKALAHNGNDPAVALRVMQKSPEMMKKYPHLADIVMAKYGGPAKWEDLKNKQAELKMKQEEQRLKSLPNPSNAGNEGLSPEDYRKTLPVAQQQLFQSVAEGRNPNFQVQNRKGELTPAGQAFIHAYPDYDIAKAKEYPKLVQDFTTGPTSKSLTAYGTAINHARALYDNTGTKSYIPGTDEYKRYNQDITYVATEVAKALNPSGVATESAIKEQEGALRSITNRKAAIENAEHILTGKMAETKQRWTNGQVRPSYQPPMPGISQEAQDNADYVRNHGVAAPKTSNAAPVTSPQPGAVHPVIVNGKQVGVTRDGGKTMTAN